MDRKTEKKVATMVGVSVIIGLNVGFITTIQEQKAQIETLNSKAIQLEETVENGTKENKTLKSEVKKIVEERNTALNDFNNLKDITYNKTHYNPYNLLEKSGANE